MSEQGPSELARHAAEEISPLSLRRDWEDMSCDESQQIIATIIDRHFAPLVKALERLAHPAKFSMFSYPDGWSAYQAEAEERAKFAQEALATYREEKE